MNLEETLKQAIDKAAEHCGAHNKATSVAENYRACASLLLPVLMRAAGQRNREIYDRVKHVGPEYDDLCEAADQELIKLLKGEI